MKRDIPFLSRSLMFFPGHREKLISKAIMSNADVLLPDLEDSVPGNENKLQARGKIIEFAKRGDFNGLQVFPRINDYEHEFFIDEIEELTIEGITGFMCPKVRDADDINFIDEFIGCVEINKGIKPGTFKLIPLIETASAVMNINSICQASDRIVAIALGGEDFLADTGGIRDFTGNSIFVARSMIVMAARANGINAIDTVHTDVFDFDDLKRNCHLAKSLGFDGMLVLNPKELPIAHEFFSPTSEEIAQAHEMLHLSDKAVQEGNGVAVMDGKFIGPPMVTAAEKTIQKWSLIKQKDKK